MADQQNRAGIVGQAFFQRNKDTASEGGDGFSAFKILIDEAGDPGLALKIAEGPLQRPR